MWIISRHISWLITWQLAIRLTLVSDLLPSGVIISRDNDYKARKRTRRYGGYGSWCQNFWAFTRVCNKFQADCVHVRTCHNHFHPYTPSVLKLESQIHATSKLFQFWSENSFVIFFYDAAFARYAAIDRTWRQRGVGVADAPPTLHRIGYWTIWWISRERYIAENNCSGLFSLELHALTLLRISSINSTTRCT